MWFSLAMESSIYTRISYYMSCVELHSILSVSDVEGVQFCKCREEWLVELPIVSDLQVGDGVQ